MEQSITEQLALLALQLGVIIFASNIVGRLAQKINIPSVLGELATGVILGPYLLGSIALPFFPNGFFPLPSANAGIPVSDTLYALATIGSIVLLFESGLETDFRTFFRYSFAGTIVGLGGVVFSFVFGDLLAVFIYKCGWLDPRALFLGILSTATSVGISARILSERKAIDSPEGTTIMAAAVIDDVLGIICLAIVMGIVGSGDASHVSWGKIGLVAIKSIGIWVFFTALGLAGAHFFARVLKRFHSSTSYAVLALGAALLLAGIMERCGLAMIIGAYTAGLSLSRSDLSFAIQLRLHGIYGFLVPVFFVVMGMMVDVKVLADWQTLKLGLIFTVLAILGKIIGCMLPALAVNFNPKGALRIGCGMIPRGEVALIIAGIGATTMMTLNGQQQPIVDSTLFGVAIIMTLLTTLVAPNLLMLSLNIPGRGVRKVKPDALTVHLEYPMPSTVVADFLVRQLIVNFRQEGFRHSDYSRDYSVVNFRKERSSFVMTVSDGVISFECSRADAPTIKNIYNETTYELYQNIEELRRLSPSMAVAKDADVYDKVIPYTGHDSLSLDKIIPEGGAIVDLQATTYIGAIEEMVRHLYRCGHVGDYAACLQDVLAREAQASTVMDKGVAMPHAKSSTVRQMVSVVAICRQDTPVEEDGKPLRLIILTVAPKDQDSPYMQYIAHQASRICSLASLDEVCAIKVPSELRRFFLD